MPRMMKDGEQEFYFFLTRNKNGEQQKDYNVDNN
jgi:hypothetical protein